MKKLLIFSLCSMIILFTNLTTVIADSGEGRTIYLSATEYDYPPFSVINNGEADGFSVQLLKAVAAEMGISVSFKVDQWATIKDELAAGELDILPLVGYTLERDEVFDFSVPYIVMRGNIFVREGETSIQSETDLFGKQVLVLDGDNSQEWAWSIGLNEELTTTTTYTEAFLLLSSGEYDAVLAQGLVGEKIIADERIENVNPVYIYEDGGATKLKLNLEGYEQKFCFAVVEGNSELLSILNEGLVIVSANGTYDDLYQEWFPFLISNETVSVSDVLTYVGIIVIPMIFIFLTINIILVRRSVKQKTAQIVKNNYSNQVIANAFQHQFGSATERYDYILSELGTLTESNFGFILLVDNTGHMEILSCDSKLKKMPCQHQLILQMIDKNELILQSIHFKKPILSNEFKTKYLDSSMIVLDQNVTRLISVPIQRGNNLFVVVLGNKQQKYTEDNIVQTTILMNGLWTMVERQEQNAKVEFMSFHDSLTGLYNRRFFEEQMIRLDNPRNYPITIVMGDVNGLKLINDAFGHRAGDQLLKNVGFLLDKHCRGNDVPARWGGDEFSIILPNTTKEGGKIILERIQDEAKMLNSEFGMTSISFGYDSKVDDTTTLNEIFLSAEELMYKHKLEMVDAVRGKTITTVLNTLFEKNPECKEHSEHVSAIAVAIANHMNLSKNKIADIKTTGMLHDIGKIVIDSLILNSAAIFNDEEREVMNNHPFSGSKMLSSSHDYARLSPGVLHHHERWDGTGYPNGIEGDSIPLESRIISVADAYDAMISKRSYKVKAMTKLEAKQELIKNRGSQFDPTIVDIFINHVLDELSVGEE